MAPVVQQHRVLIQVYPFPVPALGAVEIVNLQPATDRPGLERLVRYVDCRLRALKPRGGRIEADCHGGLAKVMQRSAVEGA